MIQYFFGQPATAKFSVTNYGQCAVQNGIVRIISSEQNVSFMMCDIGGSWKRLGRKLCTSPTRFPFIAPFDTDGWLWNHKWFLLPRNVQRTHHVHQQIFDNQSIHRGQAKHHVHHVLNNGDHRTTCLRRTNIVVHKQKANGICACVVGLNEMAVHFVTVVISIVGLTIGGIEGKGAVG